MSTGPYVLAQQTLLATTAMTSPRASISQTVGITRIEVDYGRPAVRGRKIWGGVIPFHSKEPDVRQFPWRAGANENTTISFNTAVSINGTEVAAGTYGLHMYVYEDGEVNVMLSSNYASWGSFYFDKEEVVANISASRATHEFEERLSFDFNDLEAESVVLSLNWENEHIPLTIEIDVKGTTLRHLRQEMQSLHMINAIGPLEAATWCLYNDTNLVEALQWVNYSISFDRMFSNLKVKSQILYVLDRDEEAEEAMKEAMPLGSASDLYRYCMELIDEKKSAEAMKVAKHSLKQSSDDWTANYGMARVYAAEGDSKKAMTYLKKAEQYCERERSKAFLKSQIEKLERGEPLG